MTTRRDWLKGVSLCSAWYWRERPLHRLRRRKVTVFAAASLKNALDAINGEWLKQTGKEATRFLCGEFGAGETDRTGRARDVFSRRDLAWMDYSQTRS